MTDEPMSPSRPMRSAVRRSMRRWRRRLGDDPMWLPLVLRATPTGTARRLRDDTQLVIEGFPRSGNTFAVFAVRLGEQRAGRQVSISSHVHTPSAIKAAARARFPTLVVVRPPLDTLVSLLIAAPHVRPTEAVDEWIHHHREVWPYRDRFEVATFDDVVHRTDVVVGRINTRFGTSLAPIDPSPQTTAAIFDAIDAHHHALYGDREHLLPRPSPGRVEVARLQRREVEQEIGRHRLAEADELYHRLAALAQPVDGCVDPA